MWKKKEVLNDKTIHNRLKKITFSIVLLSTLKLEGVRKLKPCSEGISILTPV